MRKPRPGEISPYNARAVAGPHGIWNEETLPVTEWEAPECRVVIPGHLQMSLHLKVPAVLRWADAKYREVEARHARDMAIINDLTRYLDGWQLHGLETGAKAGKELVLFADEQGRWYSVSIGVDRNGSYNIVTAFGSSQRAFMRRCLRDLVEVVKRGG